MQLNTYLEQLIQEQEQAVLKERDQVCFRETMYHFGRKLE